LVKLWLLKIFKNTHDFGTFKFLNLDFWLFETSPKKKKTREKKTGLTPVVVAGTFFWWWWWGHCERPQD
jgi:hypothetical protein